MRLRPCGDAALLAEVDDIREVMALAGSLEARRSSGPAITDVVPALRTVLVRFDPARTTESAVADWIGRSTPPPGAADRLAPDAAAHTVTLDVVYDGPDLAEVGRRTGLGPDGVVSAHTSRPWTVAFLGFAPGFAYCTGGDPALRVARRDLPRARVAAGSVGLADDLTAVYPRASPGGWQIIGRTDATVWDADRDPPALLRAGTVVQFRAV